jgi:uncharacterized protein
MMIRLRFVPVLLLIAVGCATGADVSMQPRSNAEVVRGAYDAFARGDAPAVLGVFDQGIVWNEAENFYLADRNPYVGPQAVAEGVFGRILADFDDFSAQPTEIIDGGDTVVALGRYGGTYRATGRPVNAQFVHVWKLRDGKVVQFQQYTDTAQFARAMD